MQWAFFLNDLRNSFRWKMTPAGNDQQGPDSPRAQKCNPVIRRFFKISRGSAPRRQFNPIFTSLHKPSELCVMVFSLPLLGCLIVNRLVIVTPGEAATPHPA